MFADKNYNNMKNVLQCLLILLIKTLCKISGSLYIYINQSVIHIVLLNDVQDDPDLFDKSNSFCRINIILNQYKKSILSTVLKLFENIIFIFD